MDSRTRENSIRLLRQLLDVYRSQLDTSVIEEVKGVLASLEAERANTCSKFASGIELGERVLEALGKVIRLVTEITDLMS